MKEKDIKELLETAKEVNSFRSYASTLVCPICGESLEGNIDTATLSTLTPFGRLFCPNCKFFKVEGPTIPKFDDDNGGKKLSRQEMIKKAASEVMALVERYTQLTCLGSKHEKDFSNEDIPYLR